MIARAITAIIGVVIGLFATFAVFSAILGGLDSFYLLTQDACNYGSHNSPKRVLRVAPENPDHPGDADEIDWTRDGLDVTQSGDSCAVPGANSGGTHLTPTGDEFSISGSGGNQIFDTAASTTVYAELPGSLNGGIWLDGEDIWFYSALSQNIDLYDHSAGSVVTTNSINASWHSADLHVGGVHGSGSLMYLSGIPDPNAAHVYLHDRSDGSYSTTTAIALDSANDQGFDLFVADGHVYVMQMNAYTVYAYRISDRTYAPDRNLHVSGVGGIYGIDYDGTNTYYLTGVSEKVWLSIAPGLTSLRDARAAGTLVSIAVHAENDPIVTSQLEVRGSTAYIRILADTGSTTSHVHTIDVDLSRYMPSEPNAAVADYTWIPAEDVFTAQEQLVTLLAVIAAIGMPIGAMTAIVFFGQAVLSSGMTGSGASQVLVAIAAVVIILVSIQMFQQFAGFLGTAFDAVNGDRFVVFDETLGSLAETIAEFWGVLAFAGFINIATIVWRNYSGNFSIGGNQGGL